MHLSAPVLIAEDDASITRILERTFRQHGVAVRTAADGVAALEISRAQRPSILFADWQMPGLDGLQLIEAVRRNAPAIPCILMTGYPEPGLFEVAVRVGATRLLIKPFPPTAALAALVPPPQAPEPLTPASCVDAEGQGEDASDAPSEVAAWMRQMLASADRIVGRLCHEFPCLGQDRARNALHDVILAYWHAASADILPPAAAVYGMAWHRARDIVASDAARTTRELLWCEAVLQPLTMPEDDMNAARRVSRLCNAVTVALPDEQCRITFTLWVTGERDTCSYAAALGLLHLSSREQRQMVKREKDRLIKILCRSTVLRSLAERYGKASNRLSAGPGT